MRRNPHIVIATPCYGGLVSQRYMQCLIGFLQSAPSRGIAASVELLGYDSLVTRARNTLVAKFLDNLDATHLMFIDADIGFEGDQIERMLRFDREVVAGMYPLKLIEWNDAVVDRMQRGEPMDTAVLRYVGVPESGSGRETKDGFVTAQLAGAGFLLIKREAIVRLTECLPETHYTAAHNFSAAAASNNFYALFDCMIDPDSREYLSEDYAFCVRWRSCGGALWLDIESRLTHIGPREFVGDARARYATLSA